MSSKREVNSGVRSYIAESTTRVWRKWLYDFRTLIYELSCSHVSAPYIYYNWSRREPV